MKVLFLVLGFTSLTLGLVGMILPVLPTTPFLLLSAFLFSKSSPQWYNWLVRHPKLGPYIVNFREKKIIPRKIKITAITMLWASILVSSVLLQGKLWLQAMLPGIAIAVSIHICSYKSED